MDPIVPIRYPIDIWKLPPNHTQTVAGELVGTGIQALVLQGAGPATGFTYDTTTGIFTCADQGTYSFTASVNITLDGSGQSPQSMYFWWAYVPTESPPVAAELNKFSGILQKTGAEDPRPAESLNSSIVCSLLAGEFLSPIVASTEGATIAQLPSNHPTTISIQRLF